jgi:hypothetical protein
VTARHFIETTVGAKKRVVTCMAPDSEYCYFCDVYAALDETGFFTKDVIVLPDGSRYRVDEGVRNAATGLAPAVQYLFVTSWMVHETKTKTGAKKEDGSDVEYKNYKPAPFGAEHEHGKFFAVKAQTILDQIQNILNGAGGRDVVEGDELGSYLIFRKRGNRYEIALSDQTGVEIQNQDLVKKYPTSMMKMGDKGKMSPEQASAFLQDRQSCWWGHKLEKIVDLSVDTEPDLPFDLEGDVQE